MATLGHGWRANETIGRTLHLILTSVGGSWPRINAMSVQGKAPLYVIGEWEEASPWEPLHVASGYDAKDSTITILTPSSINITNGGIKDILFTVSGERVCYSCEVGLIIPPQIAWIVAKEGLKTRADIVRFIHENARAPIERVNFRKGVEPSWVKQTDPKTLIPIVEKAEQIVLVVAGGANHVMYVYLPAWFSGGVTIVPPTKIELPKNWQEVLTRDAEAIRPVELEVEEPGLETLLRVK